MKVYFRIFLIALIVFSGVFAGGFMIFDKQLTEATAPITLPEDETATQEIIVENDADKVEEKTSLEKLIETSDRVNVLCVGMEDYRTDTIMLASFDTEKKIVDVISIPRDTYNYVPGHETPGQKKINAVYGMKGVGGIEGLRNYISSLVGVPIDYYVTVDYDGLSAVVDVLGGYSVNVPFDMVYDDPFDDPPLHIDIKKGQQTLSGEETMKYLRFRKSNDGTIQEGDIQRIARQQAFVTSMIQKSLSLQLPAVINTAINYVNTDISAGNAVMLGASAVGLDMANVTMHTIPGEPGYANGASYYFHDPGKLEEMMEAIYAQ